MKHIENYCDLMEEIKRRIEVIDVLRSADFQSLPRIAKVESIALQFRKILELIAMGSLVANREALASASNSFASEWNAKRILAAIHKVNPDFYPRAVLEKPGSNPKVLHDLVDRTDDVLTRKDSSSSIMIAAVFCTRAILLGLKQATALSRIGSTSCAGRSSPCSIITRFGWWAVPTCG